MLVYIPNVLQERQQNFLKQQNQEKIPMQPYSCKKKDNGYYMPEYLKEHSNQNHQSHNLQIRPVRKDIPLGLLLFDRNQVLKRLTLPLFYLTLSKNTETETGSSKFLTKKEILASYPFCSGLASTSTK